MTIPLKRHHRHRLKNKRRWHWGRDLTGETKPLAQAVNTPRPCSCFMCGNPRKHFGQKTRAELRNADFFTAGLAAWNNFGGHGPDMADAMRP